MVSPCLLVFALVGPPACVEDEAALSDFAEDESEADDDGGPEQPGPERGIPNAELDECELHGCGPVPPPAGPELFYLGPVEDRLLLRVDSDWVLHVNELPGPTITADAELQILVEHDPQGIAPYCTAEGGCSPAPFDFDRKLLGELDLVVVLDTDAGWSPQNLDLSDATSSAGATALISAAAGEMRKIKVKVVVLPTDGT